MSHILTLHHLQQATEGSCLLACVGMVLSHLGIESSEAKIRRTLGAREFGTPSFAVRRLASLGLWVNYGEWSLPQLLDSLAVGRPVILFVRTGFLDYWEEDVAHAVVVVGAEEEQRFWLHDPILAVGPRSVGWDGLLAAWAEFEYRGAAISIAPPEGHSVE